MPASQKNAATARDDMRRFADALRETYGKEHVFDALPILNGVSSKTGDDAADIEAGYAPRSLYVDPLHLNEASLTAVANALTAPGGPMEQVRNL